MVTIKWVPGARRMYARSIRKNRASVSALKWRKASRGFRRKYGRGNRLALRGGYGPFPQRLNCVFNYVWTGSLASVAGAFVNNIFRTNSCYDPDSTGVGAQPRGYDTLLGASGSSAPYSYMVVRGCKMICQFYNATAIAGMIGLAHYEASGDAPTSFTDCMENRNTKWTHLTQLTGGKCQKTISRYIPMWKEFGTTKQRVIDDPAFYHAYNGNPSASAYGMVFWQPDTVNDASVTVSVRMRFYCTLTNPNKLSQS